MSTVGGLKEKNMRQSVLNLKMKKQQLAASLMMPTKSAATLGGGPPKRASIKF